MKEDFLHYVWKHQKVSAPLITEQGFPVRVLKPESHNKHGGPDFEYAELILNDLRWVGAIEIHLRSSDWYRHGHHNDPAYDTVILHVVWEDDVEVCRNDGTLMHTLALKKVVPAKLLNRYEITFKSTIKFIPCEHEIAQVEETHWVLWKERLYIERLEERSKRIHQLLVKTKQNWEAVLFVLLARNFGLNVNGEAFYQLALSIPFSVVRKLQNNGKHLEALFLGQAGLIPTSSDVAYVTLLRNDYTFLRQKFGLKPIEERCQFSRLRPHNFPTIRLVQMAQLYAATSSVFSLIFGKGELQTKWMKNIAVSPFWRTHYTFNKTSKERSKKLTDAFVDLLVINTLIPYYFSHQKAHGKEVSEKILGWIRKIKLEKNSLVEKYRRLGILAENALDSQALIHLNKSYCQSKKCLLCAVGNQLMKQE